jgi:hypothetical protein
MRFQDLQNHAGTCRINNVSLWRLQCNFCSGLQVRLLYFSIIRDQKLRQYGDPKRPITALAALMLAYGYILDFPSPAGTNSSYTMMILTFQMSCSQKSVDISETENISGPASIEHFTVGWTRQSSRDGVTDPAFLPNLTITSVSLLGWYNTF